VQLKRKIIVGFSNISSSWYDYCLGNSFLVVMKNLYGFTHSSKGGLKRLVKSNGNEDKREGF
jgi:hypothetical protein